jgi:hypothetical protein
LVTADFCEFNAVLINKQAIDKPVYFIGLWEREAAALEAFRGQNLQPQHQRSPERTGEISTVAGK